MAWQEWLVFAQLALVTVISPGPALLLAISNGMCGGMRAVFYGAVGNVCGLFVVGCLSFIGIDAVLHHSIVLFLIVKLIGGAYLIYIGFSKVLDKSARSDIYQTELETKPGGKIKSNWLEGFVVAVTNPRVILFFIALFPQFINRSEPLIGQFLLMTGTFMLLSLIGFCGYGWLAKRSQQFLSRPGVIDRFHRMTGGVFIGLGVYMLQLRAGS